MAEGTVDIQRVANELFEVLAGEGIHPSEMILYGSHARGEASRWSDIDIVIVSDDLERWPPLERLELLSRLAARVDAPLEVLGYTPNEIAAAGDHSILWSEIKRHGKPLEAA
jgi:predicted nucleotidyltransferase